LGRGLAPPSCRACSAHIDIGRRLPAFPVPPPCVRVTYTAVRRAELPMKPKAGRSALKRRPARFGPSGQSLGASPLLAAREARHYWRFCRHPLRRPMDLLVPLTVWAFLPRHRVSTIPAADFCPGVRRPHDLLSPEPGTPGRSPEVSLTAVRAQPPDLRPVPLMDMGFAHLRSLARHSRLRSGSCSSARAFAHRFLQTPPRGDALAGRYPFTSIRLGRGLAPPSCQACSAHVDTHGLTPVALAEVIWSR